MKLTFKLNSFFFQLLDRLKKTAKTFSIFCKKIQIILQQTMKRMTHDKDRMTLLESIGLLDHSETTPYLESFLKGPQILAYTALRGYLRQAHQISKETVEKYLLDSEWPDILKQVFLKGLLKKKAPVLQNPLILHLLETLLKHSNLNIRYLTLNILRWHISKNACLILLNSFLYEKDPDQITILKEVITHFFEKQPTLLSEIWPLIQNESLKKDIPFLLRDSTKNLNSLWDQMIQPLLFIELKTINTFFNFAAHLIWKHIFPLERMIFVFDDEATRISFLLALIQEKTNHTFSTQHRNNFILLEKWFDEGSANIQDLILNLLDYQPFSKMIPLLLKGNLETSERTLRNFIFENI